MTSLGWLGCKTSTQKYVAVLELVKYTNSCIIYLQCKGSNVGAVYLKHNYAVILLLIWYCSLSIESPVWCYFFWFPMFTYIICVYRDPVGNLGMVLMKCSAQMQNSGNISCWNIWAASSEKVPLNRYKMCRVRPSCACHQSLSSQFIHLGPVVQSVVSLTSSLRVISLTVLADSIYNILIFLAEKMLLAFALQKLLTFFQQKISAYLRITRCKF